MKKGFTLIELLVVVLILGVLSSIAMWQYTKLVERAKATEAFSNMFMLEQAVDLYLAQNGYPATKEQTADLPTILNAAGMELSDGNWYGDNYATKNFLYAGWADPDKAHILIQPQGHQYKLLYAKWKDGRTVRACAIPEKDPTDIDIAICKNFPSNYKLGEYRSEIVSGPYPIEAKPK